MPELPEVQTIVNALAPAVVGRRIEAFDLRRRDIVTPRDIDLSQHLTGHIVTSLTRRGKRIVFLLDDDHRFYLHLGMTGRLTLESPATPLLPHTHLILRFGPTEIRFVDPRRFGGLFWLGLDSPDGNMGPEPLEMSAADLAQRLSNTSRPIKNALMDQTLIAGLGNIYVDESLFTAAIHPLSPADHLSPRQVATLLRSIKSTLRRALRHRGSTLRDYRDAAGNKGGFQKLHRVYARDGQPCPACQSIIQRLVLAGRSTCFCPRCQPR